MRLSCRPFCVSFIRMARFFNFLIHHWMMPCYVTFMARVCDVSYKRLNKYLAETVEGEWDLRLLENERR